MISVEAYVWIMLVLMVLRGIISVYEDINKSKMKTCYNSEHCIVGIIFIIFGIIALMW